MLAMASMLQRAPRDKSGYQTSVFDEEESLFLHVLDSHRALRKFCSKEIAMRKADEAKDPNGSEENGTSLFHRIWAQRTLMNFQDNMKFLLHRLIVIARVCPSPDNNNDLAAHWEAFNLNVQRRHYGDSVTGLLLLYPTCLLHVVECSSEVLVSVLKELQDMQVQPHNPPIVDTRILVVSHDLPGRLFQQWSCKTVVQSAQTLADGLEREAMDKQVTNILYKLLRLGQHLLKTPKGSKAALESALDQVPELVIPQNIVEKLVGEEELLTPQQYLHVYHSPVNMVIDSGHIFGSSQPTTV